MLKMYVHLFLFIFQPHSERQFHTRQWKTQTSETCQRFHSEEAEPELKLGRSPAPIPSPVPALRPRATTAWVPCPLAAGHVWPFGGTSRRWERGWDRSLGACPHHPHSTNISLEQGGPSPKTTTVSRLFPPLVPLGLG